ncbi:hypothetical protein DPEC_G00223800, partial [Dallia pectoralis]
GELLVCAPGYSCEDQLKLKITRLQQLEKKYKYIYIYIQNTEEIVQVCPSILEGEYL